MPIQPGKSENEQEFISRCMSEETQDYEQAQAYAICKSKWDNSNMSKMDTFSKNKLKFEQQLAVADLIQRGVNLAPEGEGKSYPWDECIADQTERYGDEETAKRICGYIKSQYGS